MRQALWHFMGEANTSVNSCYSRDKCTGYPIALAVGLVLRPMEEQEGTTAKLPEARQPAAAALLTQASAPFSISDFQP